MTEFDQLLKKWLDGSYTARDERAMRMLIEQDSDAREALDGYLMQPELQHTGHLQKLLDSLQVKEPKKPIYLAYGKYLAAAASLVLILAAWWLLQPQKNFTSNQETATTQPSQISDTNQITSTSEAVIAQADESRSPSIGTRPRATTIDRATGNMHLKTVPPPISMVEEPAVAMAEKTESAQAATEAYQEDIAVVVQTAPPAAPQSVKSKTSTGQPVVTESRKFDTDKKMAPAADESQTPEPEHGWNAFDLYLRDALVYPSDASARKLTGSVRLSFSIDEQGTPTQVRVTRSLCLTCDVEAIRVLVEGPKWKPAGRKSVNVEIRFPR